DVRHRGAVRHPAGAPRGGRLAGAELRDRRIGDDRSCLPERPAAGGDGAGLAFPATVGTCGCWDGARALDAGAAIGGLRRAAAGAGRDPFEHDLSVELRRAESAQCFHGLGRAVAQPTVELRGLLELLPANTRDAHVAAFEL